MHSVTISSKTFESEKQQFVTTKIYESLFNKERYIMRFGAISLLERLLLEKKPKNVLTYLLNKYKHQQPIKMPNGAFTHYTEKLK